VCFFISFLSFLVISDISCRGLQLLYWLSVSIKSNQVIYLLRSSSVGICEGRGGSTPPVHVLNPPSWAYWYVLGGQNISPRSQLHTFFVSIALFSFFGLHKVAKAPRCNVARDSCKFQTDEIVSTHIFFNFDPKFTQNGVFGPKVCIFKRTFSDQKTNFPTFADKPHFFFGGGIHPPFRASDYVAEHLYI